MIPQICRYCKRYLGLISIEEYKQRKRALLADNHVSKASELIGSGVQRFRDCQASAFPHGLEHVFSLARFGVNSFPHTTQLFVLLLPSNFFRTDKRP